MDIQQTNVGRPERVISAVGGGVLLGFGLKRGSLAGTAMGIAGGDLLARGLTGHSVIYQLLGTRTTGDASSEAMPEQPEIVRAVTILKPAADLYHQWRDPKQLSRIMGNEFEVTPSGDHQVHWAVKTPVGKTIEWDARITEDAPGERIAWQSDDGAPIPNRGAVEYQSAPIDRGTEVTLHLRFDPPGGALGDTVAKVLGFAPAILAMNALRRAKSLAETGETPTSAGPAAR